ncbi:helix-turn-helix transcriptional regulator [Streptomyces sp. NPDC059176]|uniref:helix-turn-helix transcriptional regulator n=1 Tax=unclassified Streptomyces TaxID=2593676 RepID=UPI0036D017E2
MSVLGLSENESEVYQHLLRHPGIRDITDGLCLDIPSTQVERAVARLCALGILKESEEGALYALEPESAIDRLADLRLQELHQEFQGITHSRRLVGELRADRADPLGPARCLQGVERLWDAADVRDRMDDLAFFCRREILSVEPCTALTLENIAHAAPLDRRLLRRGVRIRSVVPKAVLRDPQTLVYLRDLARQGAEVRVAEGFGDRVLVYDSGVVLVPAGDASRGALVMQDSALVTPVRSLLESIWEAAEKLPDDDRSAATSGPSEIERRVLALMCQVTKDESGARTLGVSVRTYRRHIADLLSALGASNRAHAALIARERGWI